MITTGINNHGPDGIMALVYEPPASRHGSVEHRTRFAVLPGNFLDGSIKVKAARYQHRSGFAWSAIISDSPNIRNSQHGLKPAKPTQHIIYNFQCQHTIQPSFLNQRVHLMNTVTNTVRCRSNRHHISVFNNLTGS